MTKLTLPQIIALQFIAKAPWIASWWGGKPHSGYPKELNARSVQKLIELKFAHAIHVGRFDRALTITDAGLAALQALPKWEIVGDNRRRENH